MPDDIQWVQPGRNRSSNEPYVSIGKHSLGLSVGLVRELGNPERVKVGKSESRLVIAPCGPSEGWKLGRNRQIGSGTLLDALEDIQGRHYGVVENQLFTAELSNKKAVS